MRRTSITPADLRAGRARFLPIMYAPVADAYGTVIDYPERGPVAHLAAGDYRLQLDGSGDVERDVAGVDRLIAALQRFRTDLTAGTTVAPAVASGDVAVATRRAA